MDRRPLPLFVLDDARSELPILREQLTSIERAMQAVRREGLPRRLRRRREGELRALRSSVVMDIEYATRAAERLACAGDWDDLDDCPARAG